MSTLTGERSRHALDSARPLHDHERQPLETSASNSQRKMAGVNTDSRPIVGVFKSVQCSNEKIGTDEMVTGGWLYYDNNCF